MSPSQAAIEKYISPEETPDMRQGYVIQIQHPEINVLEKQIIARIGQCVLTAPSANAFDFMPENFKEGVFKIGRKIAYFGDGYEKKEKMYDRNVWVIPRMDENFIIDEKMGYTTGYDSNFTIFAKTRDYALKAAEKAIKEIKTVDGVVNIGVNGIIATASKKGAHKYSFLRASLYEKNYPSIREQVSDTEVPEGAKAAYEIVTIGIDFDLVKEAMRRGVIAAKDSPGVLAITAANYGGTLGDKKIYLRELIE